MEPRTSVTFAGRTLEIRKDHIGIHFENYIKKELKMVSVTRGRLSQKSEPTTEAEKVALRTTVYQLNWLGKEGCPTVAGTASLLASRLEKSTVEDISIANAAVRSLKETASLTLKLWKFKSIHDIIPVTFSDCAGPGSAANGSSQGAHVLCLSEKKLATGDLAKIFLIRWRSNKIRRTVASTFVGEAVTFSESLAEVEYLQVMLRDIIHNDVNVRNWTASLGCFIPIALELSELKNYSEALNVIDAKSVYDAVIRNGSSLKQGRRTAIDLAMARETLQHVQATIRWCPHTKMIADCLTKAEVSKGNDAMASVIRNGTYRLAPETDEHRMRQEDPLRKLRDRRTSATLMKEAQDCDEDYTDRNK